jgi:hypothetical protein
MFRKEKAMGTKKHGVWFCRYEEGSSMDRSGLVSYIGHIFKHHILPLWALDKPMNVIGEYARVKRWRRLYFLAHYLRGIGMFS